MKIIATIGTLVASASSVMAGSLTYVAPEAITLEEPASMGGSGSWIIPLIILSILIISFSGSKKYLPCGENGQPNGAGILKC